jgi:hypothetical protein
MSQVFELVLRRLERDLRLRVGVAVRTSVAELSAAAGVLLDYVLDAARTRLEDELAEAAKERAEGHAEVAAERDEMAKERVTMLAEVADERAQGIAKVDARQAELWSEIAAMHTHRESQQGHVKLNVGGKRFETSVQTLRRISHTFFDAYFSGRYAQDVCEDGSIFVDRDGEHFGYVLEYMRDGHLSVAEPSARSPVRGALTCCSL